MDYQDFLKQKETKSVKTLKNYRNPINQVFRKAIRMELMTFNPLESVEVSIFKKSFVIHGSFQHRTFL